MISTRTILLITLAFVVPNLTVLAQAPKLSEDSKPQPGVPAGKVHGPFEWKSKIYPGTVRNYWVYVPAQYDESRPACTLVVQDGLGRAKGWRLTTVLDNLIHRKEVPVIIGIFVHHGVVPATKKNAQPRFNRSFEYDGLGDRYARFLLEEILPEVGKSYNLSDDPNDRAIAGASSGGICAFTAAWERPDAFRRVLSTIGTFVGLRGGDVYPTLIRKCEPKPIRVFLEDGRKDLDIYGGDWFTANLDMLSALRFAGYDVAHAWGDGGHDSRHAAEIMPEALRWLWRGYPEPVRARPTPQRRTDVVIPGEGWTLVSTGLGACDGPAVNARGEIFFSQPKGGVVQRVGLDGKVERFVQDVDGIRDLMFGEDGALYATAAQGILRVDPSGAVSKIIDGAVASDLVRVPRGLYTAEATRGSITFVDHDGRARRVASGLDSPTALITSPDHAFLWVASATGRFVESFRIEEDGSLSHRQRYGHLHLTDLADGPGASGMTVDTKGRTYIATKVGIQVLDQLGRVHLILSVPSSGDATDIAFGGADRDTLYLTTEQGLYRRKIRARGAVPWEGPVKPPRPGL